MQQDIKGLIGYKLAAADGGIGRIRDFYFDDSTWTVRYAVADTGSWLRGQLVLLSPRAFGRLDHARKTLGINLSLKQIERCPPIEAHKPVSRQYEIEYHKYYGLTEYWAGGAMAGLGGFPMVMPLATDSKTAQARHNRRDDKHLQSTLSVTGFHVQAIDAMIGRVSGFLVDSDNWVLGELLIDAGHWYSGREIRVSSASVERISVEESTVFVSLSKADIERTAEHHVARAAADGPRGREARRHLTHSGQR